jgi:peptide-methionine (R)-S-oxide reductase
MMNRRHFLITAVGTTLVTAMATRSYGLNNVLPTSIDKIVKSDKQWRALLTSRQYAILRREDTEPSFSSALNAEKRPGQYVCAGCALPLFTSAMKFDSGTGWPSFFTAIPNMVETRLDLKMLYPRREYHCARCGGHQGHVFKDGPQPTGQRWCNNGLALQFIPA